MTEVALELLAVRMSSSPSFGKDTYAHTPQAVAKAPKIQKMIRHRAARRPPKTRPRMNPTGWAAPIRAKLLFLIGPSGIELPRMPTPAGMSIAAARPRPAQQPIKPSPVFMNVVVIQTAAKHTIPRRKTRRRPNASAIAPAMSKRAPLTKLNMDNGHDSSPCDRLTDLAMEGNATVNAPLRKLVRMVTPLIAVRERMMRVTAESFGGDRMLDSFRDEKAPRRNSDKLLDRCMLIVAFTLQSYCAW